MASCGLEVADVPGNDDVFVVEGLTSERASRSRQVAFVGQLAHFGDGIAESRLLRLVRPPKGDRFFISERLLSLDTPTSVGAPWWLVME